LSPLFHVVSIYRIFWELFDFVKTKISYKQKEESSGKEILDLKERVRDLEDKLKKSENSRSYDILGTSQRLNISSRQVIEDDDNDHDTSEKRNGEKTPIDTEDSDPLFPGYQYLPSNTGPPSQRVESTSNEEVRKCYVLYYCSTSAQPSLW
jgi:hypothetical protein